MAACQCDFRSGGCAQCACGMRGLLRRGRHRCSDARRDGGLSGLQGCLSPEQGYGGYAWPCRLRVARSGGRRRNGCVRRTGHQ